MKEGIHKGGNFFRVAVSYVLNRTSHDHYRAMLFFVGKSSGESLFNIVVEEVTIEAKNVVESNTVGEGMQNGHVHGIHGEQLTSNN